MLSLGSLVYALSASPIAMTMSLSKLLSFIRLCNTLRPVILHRLPPPWDVSATPANLPRYIMSFISHRIGAPEECLQEAWTALGTWIWTMGESLLREDPTSEGEDGWDKEEVDWLICK